MVEKSEAEKAADIIIAKRQRQGDDTTNIHMVPGGQSKDEDIVIECLGMFFNENEITKDAEPTTALNIEKDVLDRSSGFIVGRFGFEIDRRSKLVFEVTLDGVKMDDYGTNLPYMESSGVYDTTLFEYPGSAKANEDGEHNVHVKSGLITGIVENQLGLVDWAKVQAYSEADFTITLLPHKIVD